jgi:hypothetical protein
MIGDSVSITASPGGTAGSPALATPAPATAAITLATLATTLATPALATPAPAAAPAAAAAFGAEVLLGHHADHLLRDAQVLDVVAADNNLRQPPEPIAVARGADHAAQAVERG